MSEQAEAARGRPGPPPMIYAATELLRVVGEAASLSLSWMPLLASAPQGDGHPVLVLPGFAAGDGSTLVLRRFLSRLGYRTLPWGLGRNSGAPAQAFSLMRRFHRLAHTFAQPISIVGQSLGGVYAREIARKFPGAVRLVVTLGSPFAASSRQETNPLVRLLFERMSGVSIEQMRSTMVRQDPRVPPPVPVTALYSKTDGVVNWRTCMEVETERTENIEVVGSHSGMTVHPLVLHVIADRLAQGCDDWLKFDRRQGMRALVFP